MESQYGDDLTWCKKPDIDVVPYQSGYRKNRQAPRSIYGRIIHNFFLSSQHHRDHRKIPPSTELYLKYSLHQNRIRQGHQGMSTL